MHKNGWTFTAHAGYDDDFSAFVPLPPKFAKLGKEGATFSCMSFGLLGGVWRPIDRYGDNIVVANVYPPRKCLCPSSVALQLARAS